MLFAHQRVDNYICHAQPERHDLSVRIRRMIIINILKNHVSGRLGLNVPHLCGPINALLLLTLDQETKLK